MDLLRQLKELLNPSALINWGGYPALMAIIFAETGLLVGFFLPGDSLLVTAGVFVNADLLNPLGLPPFVNLLVLNVVLMVMSIAGASPSDVKAGGEDERSRPGRSREGSALGDRAGGAEIS